MQLYMYDHSDSPGLYAYEKIVSKFYVKIGWVSKDDVQ